MKTKHFLKGEVLETRCCPFGVSRRTGQMNAFYGINCISLYFRLGPFWASRVPLKRCCMTTWRSARQRDRRRNFRQHRCRRRRILNFRSSFTFIRKSDRFWRRRLNIIFFLHIMWRGEIMLTSTWNGFLFNDIAFVRRGWPQFQEPAISPQNFLWIF